MSKKNTQFILRIISELLFNFINSSKGRNHEHTYNIISGNIPSVNSFARLELSYFEKAHPLQFHPET